MGCTRKQLSCVRTPTNEWIDFDHCFPDVHIPLLTNHGFLKTHAHCLWVKYIPCNRTSTESVPAQEVNISYLHQLYCLRSSSRFTWYKNRAPQFSMDFNNNAMPEVYLMFRNIQIILFVFKDPFYLSMILP